MMITLYRLYIVIELYVTLRPYYTMHGFTGVFISPRVFISPPKCKENARKIQNASLKRENVSILHYALGKNAS